jgi:hypothetical protein
VRCEVIGSRKGSHTNATLERLLTSMNANMAGEFVATRESSIAIFYGACVGAFVHGCLTRSIWILAGFNGD